MMTPNDIHNAVDTARREGWEEGMEEGEAKGRTEEKLALAQKMKSKGFSVADIADMTGLPAAEIEQL